VTRPARAFPASFPAAALLALAMLTGAAHAQQRAIAPVLDQALRDLDPLATTGVLYDRVLPLAHLEQLDGRAGGPVVDRDRWKQGYDELRRASLGAPVGPSLADVEASARSAARSGVLPLAFFDRAFDRVRPSAMSDGSLRIEAGRVVPTAGAAPLEAARAVAGAVLAPAAYRGADVTFRLDRERWFGDAPPAAVRVDFGDGLGERPVAFGEPVRVHYGTTGTKTLVASFVRVDGSVGVTRFAYPVAALAAPLPDDTLHVTASIAYQGAYGTGDAYVDLAPGHSAIANPVVVIEGFDLDNSMYWDQLYALLNEQNLLEDLRADGYDAVVLNFTDATLPVQENAFVVEALIEQVQAMIAPQATMALVGASMGGLCSRYALTYMDAHSIPYRVRTWISFDGPQAGADIPLGLQYWISFFSGQSTDAAAFLTALDSPAARQMLLYHFGSTSGTSAAPDPQRAALVSDLASLGDWPQTTRRVAVANGSGTAENQGFSPGAQLIQYSYSGALVALTGNVWAVPDHATRQIFQGSLRILLSTTTQNVTVDNTDPWDGAPGGSRASMAQLDSTQAPYGDIVALHPSHCFIPTISSLALATSDPFFDVSAAGDVSALTPFDAVFWPDTNEEHVLLTPANAAFVKGEIEAGALAVGPGAAHPGLQLTADPNPFAGGTRLAFTLPAAGHAELRVYGVDGRLVRVLVSGPFAAGAHGVTWDGRDGGGAPAPPGLYFVRCATADAMTTRKLARLN